MAFEIHNCIPNIVMFIKQTMVGKEDHKIIWFGNKIDLFLIDYYLGQNGLHIDCVIDNDIHKRGKELSQVNHYELYKRYFDWEYRHKIYFFLPEQIVDPEEKMVFFIISAFCEEMKNQLINMGVPEECIFEFTEDEWWIVPKEDNNKTLNSLSLKDIQRLELAILKEFDTYCKKYQLTYFISSGTLLGAVRHKGFIPWDDDIDVYMPYEDYQKFMSGYKHGRFRAVDWRNEENYYLPFGKLVDTTTSLIHGGFPTWGMMSVYIDIFPLAGYPEDEPAELFWERHKEQDILWIQYYVLKTLGVENLSDIRQSIIDERYRYSFYESSIVGAAHVVPGIRQWCARREIYESTVELQFEDGYFSAPAGYDELLKIRYGDYMKLPPIEKRVAHLFPAFSDRSD